MEKFIQGLVADITMSSSSSSSSKSKSLSSDKSHIDGSDVGDGGSRTGTDHDDDLAQVPPPPKTLEIVSDNHKSHRWRFARSVSSISSSSISSNSNNSSSTPTETPESNMIGVSSSSTPSPTSTVVMDWRDARFMNNATKILMPSTSSSSSSSSSTTFSSSSASSNKNAVSMSPPRRSFDPRKHLPPQLPKRHYSPSVSSTPEPLLLKQDGREQWRSASAVNGPLQAPITTRTSGSSSSSSVRNPRMLYRRASSDMDVSDHSKGESRWSAHSVPTHSLSWSSTSSSSSSSSSLSSSSVRRKNVMFVDINGKPRMDRDFPLPSPRRSPEPTTVCCEVSDEKNDILKPSPSSMATGNLTVIVERSSSPRIKALPASVDESETLSGPKTDKQEEEEQPSSPSTTRTSLYDVLPDGQRMPMLNHQRDDALFTQNDASTLLTTTSSVDGAKTDTGPDVAASFDSVYESLNALIC